MNMDTAFIRQCAQQSNSTIPEYAERLLPKFGLMLDALTPTVSEDAFTSTDVVKAMMGWACKQPEESWNTLVKQIGRASCRERV